MCKQIIPVKVEHSDTPVPSHSTHEAQTSSALVPAEIETSYCPVPAEMEPS